MATTPGNRGKPRLVREPYTRTRTKDDRVAAPPSRSHTDGFGGAASGDALFAYGPNSGEFESMTDVVIPNFRLRRQKGEVFFNAMSKNYSNVVIGESSGPIRRAPPSGSTYQRTYEYGTSFAGWYGRTVGANTGVNGWEVPHVIPSMDVNRMIREASTACESQRARGDVNMWENLAELDQTFGLLATVFRTGATRLQDLSYRGIDKKVASSYLAWRYGIRPVIADAWELLQSVQRKVGDRDTTRAKVEDQRSGATTLFGSSSQVTLQFKRTYAREVKVRAMALDVINQFYTGSFGWALKDLLTLPWELVRLSFVLDWFTNFGDIIGSLAPNIGSTDLGSCYTVSDRCETLVECISTTPASSNVTILSPLTGTIQLVSEKKWRVPYLEASRVPLIRADFKFKNLVRLFDALALMRVQIH